MRYALFLVTIALCASCAMGCTSGEDDHETAESTSTLIEAPPSLFRPLPPKRVLDTREQAGFIPAGGEVELTIRGAGGIPNASSVTGAAATITAVPMAGAGYLTAYLSDAGPRPLASTVNFAAGEPTANATLLLLGPSGKVKIYASVATHVVVDVAGYFTTETSGSSHVLPITPTRLFDTRPFPQTEMSSSLGASMPPLTTGAMINVTVTDSDGPGFVTAYSGGSAARPTASNVNMVDASPRAAMSFVAAPNGSFDLYSNRPACLIADVTAYFQSHSSSTSVAAADARGYVVPLSPTRVLDTRTGGRAAVRPGAPLRVQVAGAGTSVPKKGAVIVNVTALAAGRQGGFVSAGDPTGKTSSVNFSSSGNAISNLAIARTDGEGYTYVASGGGLAHVVLDVVGTIDAAFADFSTVLIPEPSPGGGALEPAALAQELGAIGSECEQNSPGSVCSIAVRDLKSDVYAGYKDDRDATTASSFKWVYVAAALDAGVSSSFLEAHVHDIFRSSSNTATTAVVNATGVNFVHDFVPRVGMTSSRFCAFIGTASANNDPFCASNPGRNTFTARDVIEFLTRLDRGQIFPLGDPRRDQLLTWPLEAPKSGLGGYLLEQLPASVKATSGHKAGWLQCEGTSAIRCTSNEIGLIRTETNTYAVALLVENANPAARLNYALQNRALTYASCRIYEAMRVARSDGASPPATCSFE